MKHLLHLLTGFGLDALRVFVLLKYWLWFVVPLGGMTLTFGQLCALYFGWSLVNTSNDSEADKDFIEISVVSILKTFLYFIFALIIRATIY